MCIGHLIGAALVAYTGRLAYWDGRLLIAFICGCAAVVVASVGFLWLGVWCDYINEEDKADE